jgi:hypothetical protein
VVTKVTLAYHSCHPTFHILPFLSIPSIWLLSLLDSPCVNPPSPPPPPHSFRPPVGLSPLPSQVPFLLNALLCGSEVVVVGVGGCVCGGGVPRSRNEAVRCSTQASNVGQKCSYHSAMGDGGKSDKVALGGCMVMM